MATEAERTAETLALLAEAVEVAGMPISLDGRVREVDAEALLGYAAGSFRTMRELGNGPTFYRAAVAGSRYSYRLTHLAEWLESRIEEPLL